MTLNRSFSSRFSPKSQANGSIPSSLADVTPSSSDSGTVKALAHIKDLMKRPVEEINESMLSATLDLIAHSGATDDRKMLLEHLLSFMANHPSGKISNMARTFTIKTLYNDLAHPPATYIGPEFQFRAADGSGNNPDAPNLGKAGTPYARSVQGANPLPRNQMPDAGLVFDTLLRREKFTEHPQGLSALMFSFAALVIHSVFRSDHTPGRQHINMTSGYVDLAPLYGNDQATQDKVRNKDGRGLLHPDVFAEDRLLFLPPSVSVLLVLFNRNHNYIARRLLEINERGTWKDPAHHNHVSHAQLAKQDEEIFQIARLCNCGWFAAVVFSDYFSAILGLVRKGSSWSLEPFDELRDEDHAIFERGRGNACSVEFNCLYRWHATTSVEDEEWITLQFKELFPDKQPEDITLRDFYSKEAVLVKNEPDLEHWTFGSLQRETEGPNKGSFKDTDLANWLMGATNHRAASFGARSTPPIMRLHEIMGIEANRAWGVCSLNDFRKFLGLKTYTSFLEWNPNPEVADAAEKLYGHIDNLELYVGLQAEETKPLIEGAGLCPGYTISRAILSDAFALTRGDRFFTQDFTPYNLTAWGFADCQRDPEAYGFGSTLGRLFLRTLPNDYTKDSIYTWFPLVHPDSMEGYLKNLNKLDEYSLERPKPSGPATTVNNYVEVGQVLRSTDKYVPEYVDRAAEVLKGKGFFTASANGVEEQKRFINALAPTPEAISAIGTYFNNKTKELIEQHSFSLIGKNVRAVNIVRDVLKSVPLHWAATEIAGIPLKTKQHPHGVYTESQLFDMLAEIYQFVFLEVEAANYMPLRQKVKEHVHELTHLIKSALGSAGSKLPFANLIGTMSGIFGKKKNHNEIVKRLFEFGYSSEHVVNSILAFLVGATVEMTLALTNVVNLLLHKEYDSEVTIEADKKVDAKSLASLTAYITDALRIDPPFAGVYRVAKQDETIESLNVKQGQRLFLHIATANMNEDAFPNPRILDTTRTPRERYLQGDGCFKVLGDDLANTIMAEVLRAVLSLGNVRRGPGQSGKLARFPDTALPVLHYAYLNEKMLQSPWPTSMVVNYDVSA
ncbi:heme peroxidase [Suillus clintonianus]|uniref:heme peroxidase n=1 Tax=Suillus clintonianus TaxID=1904413 RepID=UPI001B87B479|nr:heme peroxidase [Suillus clintonianus]KAG2132772.1 heme peroxidase [Suillus clintonianus]